MKFSANLSMLYGEHGFLERFGAASADGFRGVEFIAPYAFTAAEVAKAAREADVAVVLFNSPAGDWAAGERGMACDPDRSVAFRDGIEQAIEYAAALACPRLHIMAGNLPRGVAEEVAEAVFTDNLAWAADRLENAGILALIEPINPVDMPGYGLGSLAQAERILAAVNHPSLRLQYDFYHMAMMGEPLVDQFRRLLPVIGHVQFADMPGRHEPGTGEVDFDTIFAAIAASGYEGWVGAEYRPMTGTSEGLGWVPAVPSSIQPAR